MVAKGKFSRTGFWSALLDSGRITASILFLIICATMYSRLLGVTGMPYLLTQWIATIGMSFFTLMIIYCILLIALGMILDSTSTMLILIPIFLPAVVHFGADPVWFGVLTVLGAEIGLLSPPMGISVFVVKDAIRDPEVTLKDVFRGSYPFAAMMTLLLLLMVIFPQITQL